MFHRTLKPLLASLVILVTLTPALAQIAQEPLLNRPNTVAPNLTLILDTSGSMDGSYIYQYGNIDPSGMGPQGPNEKKYARYSPDINRIYYDPRTRYWPRVDYQGNPLTQTTPKASKKDPLEWAVYFRKGSGAYTAGDLGNSSDYYADPYTPAAALVVSGSTDSYPWQVKIESLTSTTKYPKFNARSDCKNTSWCTTLEEAQNYLNWKKWYESRGEMTKTGLGAAFQPIKADAIRLGWSTISNLNSTSKLDRGVATYGDAAGGTKDLFFTWLYAQTFDNGTPNLPAVDNVGKYHQRTDSDGPWATTPNPNSTGIVTVAATGPGKSESTADHASCRRSFSMLLTDGYWNSGQPTTAGNSDNTIAATVTKPPSSNIVPYTPIYPYKDEYSNTLADLAMHYWARDLRTDLSNRVPPINSNGINNPSIWQNLSFYAVTLGIDGTLVRNTTTLANLTSGSTLWPEPKASQPSTIDDTWHATLNARGDLLNANNATELTAGLKKMFATIGGQAQTLSGVAVSATFLKDGTRKYKPEYIPGTWSGKLSAIKLDPVTGNDFEPATVFWEVEKGAQTVAPFNPISTIPAAAARTIMTWNGTAAVPFNATNTGLSSDLINYLRGDPAKELRNGGLYRNRDAILGDIVNSSPVFIKGSVDLAYEKLVGSFGDYRAFVAGKVARAEGVLFVGANDGMVHGFRDSDGKEIFAFVPKAVVPNLFKLADTPYTHQYYVDGPNTETDAYLDGAWKNIVLGTTGAGGKAVYALDVTNPLAPSVMWEANTSTLANLGSVLSDVQAGILPNGEWVAIFGNGYGSTTGEASLFVVNLATGALRAEIKTGVAAGNGLGGVRVVRDATQRIIGAYAGDLKGNMWKFDLTGAASDWKVGLAGAPLYVAKNALAKVQPITAAPAVLPHPTKGYVVSFGTGKFFETTDVSAPYETQSLYGIWDAQPFGATSTPAGAALTTGRSQLVEQTISTVTISSPPATFYNVSANPVTWGAGVTGTRGWFIELPNSGQRVAYPVDRLAGTFVLATSLSPVSAAAADVCVQTGSGSGWAYIVDGVTGSGPTKRTLDTNADGLITAADALVSGWQDPIDGRPTPIIISTNKLRDELCIETASNKCTKVELSCGQVGMPACPVTFNSSRAWRQIFLR